MNQPEPGPGTFFVGVLGGNKARLIYASRVGRLILPYLDQLLRSKHQQVMENGTAQAVSNAIDHLDIDLLARDFRILSRDPPILGWRSFRGPTDFPLSLRWPLRI